MDGNAEEGGDRHLVLPPICPDKTSTHGRLQINAKGKLHVVNYQNVLSDHAVPLESIQAAPLLITACLGAHHICGLGPKTHVSCCTAICVAKSAPSAELQLKEKVGN